MPYVPLKCNIPTEFALDAASIALSSKPQMSDLGINVLYYRAAWAAKEMQLLGFTRIAVRANIFCFTIFALWMDIEHATSLRSMNGPPTVGQYYSELCIFSFWAMYAILTLPGHLGSFLGTLFILTTSCQWQNETWIIKFCMQNLILKRIGVTWRQFSHYGKVPQLHYTSC